MRAVVWHGRGDVRLEDVDEPRPVTPGTSLVEVSRCGLCGSDRREYYAGPFMIPRSPHPLTGHSGPVTLGHEIVGTVVEVGGPAPDGPIPGPGDRVALDPTISCGSCPACRRGDTHLCAVAGCVGISAHGGLARLVLVPTAGLVSLPDHVSDDIAGAAEPLSVALHALDRGSLRPGENVVVSGFGPIGAGVTALARSAGAATIVVVEPHEGRRARALALGATAAIDPGAGEDQSDGLRDIRGFADLAFDCSGAPGSLETVLRSTRAGARVVIAAVSTGTTPIPMHQVVLRERSLIGTLGNRGDIPRVISLLSEGRVDLDGFLSDVVPLSAAVDWIRDERGDVDGLKVLVDPRL